MDAPLADRMRPRSLDELIGQEHAFGPGTPLRRLIDDDKLPSLIVWGPPGVGKTSAARLLAGTTGADFESISAVLSGLLLNVALYALLRFKVVTDGALPGAAGAGFASMLMMGFGIVSVVVAAFFLSRQRDSNRMFA